MAVLQRDLEAKIVVLGAQGVGKTAFLNRFINNAFDAEQRPTVGANFLTKRLIYSDSSPPLSIKLQIWDTAGQERFRAISKLYYRGANAALLCYDITDEQTFVEMGTWLEELRKNLGSECLIHVVGTKADIVAKEPHRRRVPFERCIQYVSGTVQKTEQYPASLASTSRISVSLGTSAPQTPGIEPRNSGFWGSDTAWDCCHEISAKDGDGVDEVFRVVTRKLVEQQDQRERQAAIQTDMLGGEHGDYFDRRGASGKGSFRLGMSDKRRSWLPSFPTTPGPSVVTEQEERRGGCC